MEFMARCGRCGALVEASSRKRGDGAITYYTPCAVVTQVSSNDVPVRDGCEYTVLCPDCMGQLEAWLAGGQDGPQEVDESAETDTAESLARDMARALDFFSSSGYSACRYFGSKPKCHGCPAASTDEVNRGCSRFMCADIRRRCKVLGIDLEAGEQ